MNDNENNTPEPLSPTSVPTANKDSTAPDNVCEDNISDSAEASSESAEVTEATTAPRQSAEHTFTESTPQTNYHRASAQPPHVPPSETVIPPFITNPPIQAPFELSRSQFPPQNTYCSFQEHVPTEEAELLRLPLPRPEPSTEHNAFRDEPSATSEVIRKKHFLFKGLRPLEGEPPHVYSGRMLHESRLLHDENITGLKSSATKISLLLLLYIVIYQSLINSISLIVRGFGLLDTEAPLQYTVLNILLYLLIYPVSFSVIIYLGNLGETHKVRTMLRKPKCSPWYVLKWFIIATGCTYVINIVYTFITTAIGYDNGVTTEPFTSVLDAVSQLVILCVFAPIFEEILFRGVMLSHHMKYGAWHACIISSLYFAFFHSNLQQFFYTFVGGLFLSMVALKTGSLISSMIMHALLNFSSFLQLLSLSLLDNADAYLNGADTFPKGSTFELIFFAFTSIIPFILMITAVIMLIVELIANRDSFKMPKGDSGLTASEKAVAYLSTPAVWVTVTVATAAIIITEILLCMNASAA